MRAVVRWSVGVPLLVCALLASLVFFGVSSLRSMPVDALPESSPPYVEIQTEALGLSASEVEEFITVPMEANLLSGVAWVETIRSQSLPGLSSIVLLFEAGTDVIRGRQMVQERLIQAGTLPRVSKPPVMLQPLSSASRVMMIGLSSTEVSLMELSVLSRWTVRPRLMGVPGVANVAVWGHRERQLQVQIDPARLRDRKVTMDQVIRTTGNALWVSPLSYVTASTPGSGGFIDTPNQRLGIRHVLPISTPEHLAKVPVEGSSVTLGEVADVVEQHQPLIGGSAGSDGQQLLLVVEKFPGVSVQTVSQGIDEALSSLAPGMKGVTVQSDIYRPATFIDQAMDNLALAGALALLLVLVLIAAFTRRVLVVAITLLSLSTSAVAGLLVLHLAGATMNLMVAVGLAMALTLLVDDIVSDVGSVLRGLRQRTKEQSPMPAVAVVIEALTQSRRAAAYAVLITLLALVPVLVSSVVVAPFARATLAAYAAALLASFAVALTLTPALCILMLRNGRAQRQSALSRALGGLYRSAHRRVAARPLLGMAVAGVLVAGGVVGTAFLEKDLAPTFKERDLTVAVKAVAGTSDPEMHRISSRVATELRQVPGIRAVGSQVGRAVMSDERTSVDSGQLWLNVEPAADYEQVLERVDGVLAGYPGVELDAQAYLTGVAGDAERADDGRALTVSLRGPDGAVLTQKAKEIRAALERVPGIVAPRVEQEVTQPEVEVLVDLDAAAKLGAKPGDVRRTATTLVSGLEVGNLFEDQKVFEVVVLGAPAARHSVQSIENLLIETPRGGAVRLAELASVRLTAGETSIGRVGVNRNLDVSADISGDPGEVLQAARSALASVSLPREHYLEVVGLDDPAGPPLWLVVLAVLVGIYLLIQAATHSWLVSAVAMAALPVALAGGVLAGLLTGGALSFGMAMGLVAVVGIAARQVIQSCATCREVENRDPTLSAGSIGAQGVEGGALLTLLPAMAVVIAAVPVLVLGPRPGLELLQPMAVTVVGGVLASTAFTMLVLPYLYLRARQRELAPVESAPGPQLTPNIQGGSQ